MVYLRAGSESIAGQPWLPNDLNKVRVGSGGRSWVECVCAHLRVSPLSVNLLLTMSTFS